MCRGKISKGGSNMKAQLMKKVEDLSVFRVKKIAEHFKGERKFDLFLLSCTHAFNAWLQREV